MKTEARGAPPSLVVGDALVFGGVLRATVVRRGVGRLLWLRFDRDGAALWRALYDVGKVVQYSYVRGPLELWHGSNAFGGRPFAAEAPSAGRPLTFEVLAALKRKGVEVASLTHAAGLSSSGDPETDALLPLEERYEIPVATEAAVARAHGRGGRIVAIGTTVVRALEGSALASGGRVRAGEGRTALRLGAESDLRVVDSLLTGLHEPGTSHFELLRAFAPAALLERAVAHAAARGYLGHELGDSMLIL